MYIWRNIQLFLLFTIYQFFRISEINILQWSSTLTVPDFTSCYTTAFTYYCRFAAKVCVTIILGFPIGKSQAKERLRFDIYRILLILQYLVFRHMADHVTFYKANSEDCMT